jgi:hypothetical protein
VVIEFTVRPIVAQRKSGNYSREETNQGRKLFAEIRYMSSQSYFGKLHNQFYFLNTLRTLLWAQWGTPTRRRKKKKEDY